MARAKATGVPFNQRRWKTISIDSEVFAQLQRRAIPLVHNINDVLRELVGLTPTERFKKAFARFEQRKKEVS